MQEKHEAENTKGCLCVDAMCHKTPDMKIAKCNIGAVGSIFYEIYIIIYLEIEFICLYKNVSLIFSNRN